MASKVQSYEDLEVWQMAMTLAEDCYRLTADFPREETYGLTSQIRRAAVSIPANIAEGFEAERATPCRETAIRVSKMLRALIRKLEEAQPPNH